MKVISYEYLNENDWSVPALLSSTNKRIDGIALIDLVEINPTTFNQKKEANDDQFYTYIDLSSIDSSKGIITNPKNLSGDQLPTRATLSVQTGDILLSNTRPDSNTIAIVEEKHNGSIASNTFFVLRTRDKKGLAFLLYFLLRSEGVQEELGILAKGTAIPTLKMKEIKQFTLPIKNFNERQSNEAKRLYYEWFNLQSRKRSLTEIVESIFKKERIYTASETAEKPLYKTIAYSNLESRFDVGYYLSPNPTVRWSYRLRPLSELAQNFRSGVSVASEHYKESGIPYVRIKDLSDGKILLNESVYVDSALADSNKKAILQEGDILISKVGTIGKVSLVSRELEGAITNQHITIVEVNKSVINPEYLLFYLQTSWAVLDLQKQSSGSAQQFIKLKDIKELAVPVPSLKEQQVIVRVIHENIEQNSVQALRKEIESFIQELLDLKE